MCFEVVGKEAVLKKNHQTQEASFCVFAIKPDLGASQTRVFSQLFKREGE